MFVTRTALTLLMFRQMDRLRRTNPLKWQLLVLYVALHHVYVNMTQCRERVIPGSPQEIPFFDRFSSIPVAWKKHRRRRRKAASEDSFPARVSQSSSLINSMKLNHNNHFTQRCYTTGSSGNTFPEKMKTWTIITKAMQPKQKIKKCTSLMFLTDLYDLDPQQQQP